MSSEKCGALRNLFVPLTPVLGPGTLPSNFRGPGTPFPRISPYFNHCNRHGAEKWGLLSPFPFTWGGEELGPHLTQCRLPETHLHTKWDLDPSTFGNNTPTLQDRQTDSGSIFLTRASFRCIMLPPTASGEPFYEQSPKKYSQWLSGIPKLLHGYVYVIRLVKTKQCNKTYLMALSQFFRVDTSVGKR